MSEYAGECFYGAGNRWGWELGSPPRHCLHYRQVFVVQKDEQGVEMCLRTHFDPLPKFLYKFNPNLAFKYNYIPTYTYIHMEIFGSQKK